MVWNNTKIQNNARITADNYELELISRVKVGSNVFSDTEKIIYLTRDYGVTSFSWDSRDELIVKKPCTRLEPISCVEQNGVDLDFKFNKENLDDIMQLMIRQHQHYYGNIARDGSPNPSIGVNKTSEEIVEKGTLNSDLSNSTNFNGNGNQYIVPTYDLRVKIKHYIYSRNRSESILFRNVTLYKPYQRTSENSAFIEEGFKGFASTIDIENLVDEANNYYDLVTNNVDYYSTSKTGKHVRRLILNTSDTRTKRIEEGKKTLN